MKFEVEMVPDPLGGGLAEAVRSSTPVKGEGTPKRGKVRDVYYFEDKLLIVTTDRVSSFDAVLPTLIPHKGESLNALSAYWFQKTRDIFPNHFLRSTDKRTMEVMKADRIDIEWVLRTYLYGSAWRAYKAGQKEISGVKLPDGLTMAEELPQVVLTPTTKSEVGHDVELSKEEAIAKSFVSEDEWDQLEEACLWLFDYYSRDARSKGIIIPDFKLEFGRFDGGLIQIDEPPTHDSARFWDRRKYEAGKGQETHCLDKEYLREYLRRVGFIGEGEPPVLPEAVVREVCKRCVASCEVLSGERSISNFDFKSVDEVMAELGGQS